MNFCILFQEAEDHCSPTPCIEGSCLNTPGGYYCHCPPERSGRHCEMFATPCKSPPCYGMYDLYNNGTLCSILFDSLNFTVGCIAPNSNSTIQCNGHGRCDIKENSQTCVCYHGFTGPYCEHSKFFSTLTWSLKRLINQKKKIKSFFRRFK